MTTPTETSSDDRWTPDEQIVDAILAGSSKAMKDLAAADRCWVVAGLKVRGLTAQDIADRLDCSLRQVRMIRAEPMTEVCLYAIRETSVFADELRLAEMGRREAVRAKEVLAEDLGRTREKLNRLIDAQIVGVKTCGQCGTPMDRYNCYEHGGKRFCRNCDRLRKRRQRAARAAEVDAVEAVIPVVENGELVLTEAGTPQPEARN